MEEVLDAVVVAEGEDAFHTANSAEVAAEVDEIDDGVVRKDLVVAVDDGY